jgi:hypothetical protein
MKSAFSLSFHHILRIRKDKQKQTNLWKNNRMQGAIFVLLAIGVFASAQKRAIPVLKHHSTKFSKKATGNLRRDAKLKVDLQEYVSVSGYFEAVIYGKDTCVHPEFKELYPVQMCALSVENPGLYSMAWVYSVPNFNYYDIYQQEYHDSACTQPANDPYFIDWFDILICTDYSLDHMIDLPLNPRQDNLGITMMTFNSQQNCMNNNFKEGSLESYYARLSTCYQSDTGDIKFPSCNTDGSLNMKTFTSTDGSCTGTSTLTSYTHSCDDNGMTTINGFVYGWMNFNCAANV